MNAFEEWQAYKNAPKPEPPKVPHSEKKPQWAYYWRKKAGLTGTRQKPVKGWRDISLDPPPQVT